MRRLLRERYEHLRSTLPERGQLQQGGQQVAARLSQATSTVKGAAQQAAAKGQQTGSTVSDLAQQAARKVKPTRPKGASTTTPIAASVQPVQPAEPTTMSAHEAAQANGLLGEPLLPDEGAGGRTPGS